MCNNKDNFSMSMSFVPILKLKPLACYNIKEKHSSNFFSNESFLHNDEDIIWDQKSLKSKSHLLSTYFVSFLESLY